MSLSACFEAAESAYRKPVDMTFNSPSIRLLGKGYNVYNTPNIDVREVVELATDVFFNMDMTFAKAWDKYHGELSYDDFMSICRVVEKDMDND